MMKWQREDNVISFEPISNCDWVEKANDIVVAKYSFIHFSDANRKLILYDPVQKNYVAINNEAYMLGKNLDSMNVYYNGGWVNRWPKESYFIKAKNCSLISKNNGEYLT
jgi:hypothetical protein